MEGRVVGLPAEARVQHDDRQVHPRVDCPVARVGVDVGGRQARVAMEVVYDERHPEVDDDGREECAVGELCQSHKDGRRTRRRGRRTGDDHGHQRDDAYEDEVEQLQDHRPVLECEQPPLIEGVVLHLQCEECGCRTCQEQSQQEEPRRWQSDHASQQPCATVDLLPRSPVRRDGVDVLYRLGYEEADQLISAAPPPWRSLLRRHASRNRSELRQRKAVVGPLRLSGSPFAAGRLIRKVRRRRLPKSARDWVSYPTG